MLDKMRSQAKLFIYVVVVAFVLMIVFSWGMDILDKRPNSAKKEVVGKFEDKEITSREYYYAVQKAYMDFKEKNEGQDISEYQMENLRENAWNELVNSYLMADIIEKENIKVSDAEIAQFIKFAPPQEVRNIEQFHTDGQFDPGKYLGFIQSPQSQEFITQMEYMFRSSLPQDKLYYRFFSTINVTDAELKEYYEMKNNKVQIDFISYSTNLISNDEVQVEKNEIEQYYNENKEEYKSPEFLTLQALKLDKNPSKEDLEAARKKIDDIYRRLKSGADFAEIATAESDDARTAQNGGDIGYVRKNTLKLKEVEEKLFSLKEGELSSPFHTKDGWMILKANEIRPISDTSEQVEVKAAQILVKETPSDYTLSDLEEKGQQVLEFASKKGIEAAAKEYSLEMIEVDQVNRNSYYVQKLGMIQGMQGFLKNADKETLANRVFETTKANYIIYAQDVIEESYRPLVEVEKQINNQLIQEKKLEKLKVLVDNKAQVLSSAQSLAQIDPTAQITNSPLFTRMDNVPGVGQGNEVIAKSFTLKQGEIAGPIEADNKFYFIQLKDKIESTEDEFVANKQQVLGEYVQYIRNMRFQAWYRSVRENYKIEDYRFEFVD